MDSQYQRDYYLKNKTKLRAQHRSYYLKNRERVIKIQALESRYYRMRKRLELIKLLGGKCINCKESNPDYLQFDHINDDGYIERTADKIHNIGIIFYNKMLRYKDVVNKLQVLCANCNWIKRSMRIELIWLEKHKIPPF